VADAKVFDLTEERVKLAIKVARERGMTATAAMFEMALKATKEPEDATPDEQGFLETAFCCLCELAMQELLKDFEGGKSG
jgi:hypothetical protein